MREIVRTFFSKKKAGQSEYRNGRMRRGEGGIKKSRNSSRQSLAEPAAFYCAKLKPPPPRLQSYFVRFAIRHLPTRTNSIQREWPHYIQLDHQLHACCQRDAATSRQCWHWYCWKLNILTREGRFAAVVSWNGWRSSWRTLCFKFYQRDLQSRRVSTKDAGEEKLNF